MRKDGAAVADKETEEKYFMERYAAQPEQEKPVMLLARAYEEFAVNYDDEAAARLLDLYFSAHADDTNVRIPALILRGRLCDGKGDTDGALAAYTEAARAETESEMGYGAPLVYAYFVAGRKIAEHYDEAERYVSMIYETLSDANNAYIANRLMSVFAEAKGDTEKAEYYGHKADALLDGMKKDAKPLFFRAIKVAPGDCGSQKEIAAEMKRGRFVLRDYGDGCLWERKRTFGMQYVSIVSLYDVVCVTAYISWRDVMAGQTCVDGLNGFIGCAIKIPLKRFVKKLVKKISARAECGKPCAASEKSVR